jgi:hypothetical protein
MSYRAAVVPCGKLTEHDRHNKEALIAVLVAIVSSFTARL